jgi:hypothetical protein
MCCGSFPADLGAPTIPTFLVLLKRMQDLTAALFLPWVFLFPHGSGLPYISYSRYAFSVHSLKFMLKSQTWHGEESMTDLNQFYLDLI